MQPSKWIVELSAHLPVANVACRAIKQRIEGVEYFLPRAAFLWRDDPEYIHGLRVATRRAVTTLDLFASMLPDKKSRRLRRQLRKLRKSADAARDLDIYLLRLGQLSVDGAEELCHRLQKQRKKAQRPVLAQVLPLLTNDPMIVRSLLNRIVVRPEAPSQYGDWSALTLREEWKAVLASTPPLDPDPDELHEFRIAGKRFRYALEVLSGGLPRAAREELLPQIEQLQAKLGTIQDRAVAADRLSAWQSKTRKPKEKRLLASLEASEREQFAEQVEAFRNWWHPEYVARLGALVTNVTKKS